MALWLGVVLSPLPLRAEALVISAPCVEAPDKGSALRDIVLDVAWQRSWCDAGAFCSGDVQSPAANWDAVWVFAKFARWDPKNLVWGPWRHVTLSTSSGDQDVPPGSLVTVGRTPMALGAGKGVFLFRSTAGTGPTQFKGLRLRWRSDLDGIGIHDKVQVKVFGVEMVYIPQGDYYLGDGSRTPNANFKPMAGTPRGVLVRRSGFDLVGASDAANKYDDDVLRKGGIIISGSLGLGRPDGGVINAAFPTGYGAFYVMKYELSQAMYRDFLNTLSPLQQATRTSSREPWRYAMAASEVVINRNGIRVSGADSAGNVIFGSDLGGIAENKKSFANGIFNEPDDGMLVPVNLITWMDLAAFADWAGLRPLTELEFEKAARGPRPPAADDYAWGVTPLVPVTGIADSGRDDEHPLNAGANAVVVDQPQVQGPLRSGALAQGLGCVKDCPGASFYGVMELSGNLWERVVTIGNEAGRAFDGTPGDGTLSLDGNADTPSWPGFKEGEVRGADGAGFRGGSWIYGAPQARVSDRTYASYGTPDRCHNMGTCGIRLARTVEP